MADDQDLRSVADVMSYQCTSCGARDEAVLEVGPVAVVTGTEYHKLQSILIGELDVYRCTVCRQPTGFRPTVVIGIGDGGDHLVCLGELAISAPEAARRQLLAGLSAQGAPPQLVETVDELRRVLAQRLRALTERVFKVAGGDAIVDELTSGGWRQFTSVHFVASALLLSTNIAGLEIATSREATAEDLLRIIARVQTTVWLSLCMS